MSVLKSSVPPLPGQGRADSLRLVGGDGASLNGASVGFARVSNAAVGRRDLSDAAKVAWIALDQWTFKGEFPSNGQLAAACGWFNADGTPTYWKARRALEELERRGLVKRIMGTGEKGRHRRHGLEVAPLLNGAPSRKTVAPALHSTPPATPESVAPALQSRERQRYTQWSASATLPASPPIASDSPDVEDHILSSSSSGITPVSAPVSTAPETTTTRENFASLPEENPEKTQATIQAVRESLGETIAAQVEEHRDGVRELLQGKLDVLPPAAKKTTGKFARETIHDVLFYMLVCSLRNGLGRGATTARDEVVKFTAGRNLVPVSSDQVKTERRDALRKAREEKERLEKEAILHPAPGSRGEKALTLIRAVHDSKIMLTLQADGKCHPGMRPDAHVFTCIETELSRDLVAHKAETVAILEAIGGKTCDQYGRLLIPDAPVAPPAEGGAA